MRVLHLVKTSIGATWALNQMYELVKLGVEVHVAIPTNGPQIEKYKEFGIVVHPINYSISPLKILKTIYLLKKIVKDVNPDIIHSHFYITTLISRFARIQNNRPLIFQVPGPLHLEKKLTKKIDLITASKNDYWVGSCTWTQKAYINSGISKDKVFLSFYGNNFGNTPIKRTNILRNELGIKDEYLLIGMVSYMYAPKRILGQKKGIKGHEDFIDAISLLIPKYDNISVVIIGGAWDSKVWYEQKIKDYSIKKCGNFINFVGSRNDIKDIYKDIDIVVHPSHSENLGGAAESLMMGVPTITSNVGGFPDIVIDNETGLLVEPQNIIQLSSAIEKMILDKDLREKIALNGQEKVRNVLNIKSTSKSIFDIYNTIINKYV
jgi:Glycosyltransferase